MGRWPRQGGWRLGSNIEIKARITGAAEAVHERATRIADSGPTLITQEDTFFVVPRGRLKLREFGGAAESCGACGPEGGAERSDRATAELIFYERPDTEEPMASTYSLVVVPDPPALKAALSAALGVRGVVSKRRTLYLAGETRIHVDEVDGLGSFLELEVVLGTAGGVTSQEDGVARCRELMDALGVDEHDLIDRAYIDLLEEAHG